MTLEMLGIQAKQAERELLRLNATKKNECLQTVADGLIGGSEEILKANAADVAAAGKRE